MVDRKKIESANLQRLFRVTQPLLSVMDHALDARQVSIAVVDDDGVNAANGGGGNLFVTTGLLAGADESLLRDIMAHEIAHEDLGHVASLKISGTGANMFLLADLAVGGTPISLIPGP